jgi:DNA modification methylase
MSIQPMQLSFNDIIKTNYSDTYRQKLIELLSQDLDFHNQDSKYASHDFHAFPAKFPPQLPDKFIHGLTKLGDTVLDPMSGSGTTVLEAFLNGRRGIAFDIDPLALLITQVKVSQYDPYVLSEIGRQIIYNARISVKKRISDLHDTLIKRWDKKTKEFIDYWFAPETQVELLALKTEIETIDDEKFKAFFLLAFSAIIITKSGGVSLAFDLAHTRPHKAKVARSQTGEILFGKQLVDNPSPRTKLLTKTLRSPIDEFEKRVRQNIKSILAFKTEGFVEPLVKAGNAELLPLEKDAVDLIVTSPPYASNAIDYMRAHKFSLVWLDYPIDDLSLKRKNYIGGESINGIEFEEMPPQTTEIIRKISRLDAKKGPVLHRYYSEMKRVLREMYRILGPQSAAIVVVGSSIMRGQDTETHNCLAEIGKSIGFDIPKIGIRNLDRNRRMLPAGSNVNLESQIQQRMHEEYVIGFYKPPAINSSPQIRSKNEYS